MIPFRIGTTSYIVEADLVTNARYLASRVDDMQLVLFDLEDGPSNFPEKAQVLELAAIGHGEGLTYSIHLPLDIEMGQAGKPMHRSLVQARQVISTTLPLRPTAYVLHLRASRLLEAGLGPAGRRRWRDQAWEALDLLAEWCGNDQLLAVENVEGFELDYLEPVLLRESIRRCIDVGHLWLDGHDPLPYLQRYLARTTVIHLHGLLERDHQALDSMKAEQLDPVIESLLQANFTDLLTLEIFGQPDFDHSLAALIASLKRVN